MLPVPLRTPPLRRYQNVFFVVSMILCAALTTCALIAILTHVTIQGIQRLDLAALTQLPPAAGATGGGLANAIAGTFLVVGLATLLSVPVGLLAGIYLSEFGKRARLVWAIRLIANVLSGLPSILAGVFAYSALIATGIVGFSAIAGGVALALLMLPLIVRTTDEALQSVSQEQRWAAASVGASMSQRTLQIVLPAALPGIITGIVLAIARATGETAPLLFTALNSSFFSLDLREPISTLSVVVYNFALSPFPAQQELAWVGALILIALVSVASGLSRLISRHSSPLR